MFSNPLHEREGVELQAIYLKILLPALEVFTAFVTLGC